MAGFGAPPSGRFSAPGDTQRDCVEQQYQAWQQANDFLKPLADKVDVLFPSLYTFYDQTHVNDWVRYAKGNIEEAHRYGKPAYPFLFMEYDPGTTLIGQQIPEDYWRVQLQTLRTYAEGLVIWGGAHYSLVGDPAVSQGVIVPWDENAPWWIATKQFPLS
ncbi:MAG: hypothetical protein NTU53_20615 [Planctomycetota bacterium]|nr:hypothetical protein [Planctomycetota bacterium]